MAFETVSGRVLLESSLFSVAFFFFLASRLADGMAAQEEMVGLFMDVTGVQNPDFARDMLAASGWNLEVGLARRNRRKKKENKRKKKEERKNERREEGESWKRWACVAQPCVCKHETKWGTK